MLRVFLTEAKVMQNSGKEGPSKRARPDSPANVFSTPEKRVSLLQDADPDHLHPRHWGTNQLCCFLSRNGFEDPELLCCIKGEREEDGK